MAVPDEDSALQALLPRLVEEFGQDWGKNLDQWVYEGRKFPSPSVRRLTNALVDELQEQYPGTSWEDVVPATSASSAFATALPASKSIDIQYGWGELIGSDFSSAQERVQPQGIWGDVLTRHPARVAEGKAAPWAWGLSQSAHASWLWRAWRTRGCWDISEGRLVSGCYSNRTCTVGERIAVTVLGLVVTGW